MQGWRAYSKVRVAASGLLMAVGVGAPPSVVARDEPPPSMLVSRQLAESERLRVGDVVQLAPDKNGSEPRSFRIAGIYEPTPDPSRLGDAALEVRLHLPDLLSLTRDPLTPEGTEHVESINIALMDPSDARQFARDVAARMPGVMARPSADAGGNAERFVILERFHQAIAAVTITAATVFLLALTIMLVEERRETVGVLRLIGVPVRRVFMQVLVEGVVIAGFGWLFGLGLALASEGLINRFFQWRYDTALVFTRITPGVAATCLMIAVPLGVVATSAASWALLRRGSLRLARR